MIKLSAIPTFTSDGSTTREPRRSTRVVGMRAWLGYFLRQGSRNKCASSVQLELNRDTQSFALCAVPRKNSFSVKKLSFGLCFSGTSSLFACDVRAPYSLVQLSTNDSWTTKQRQPSIAQLHLNRREGGRMSYLTEKETMVMHLYVRSLIRSSRPACRGVSPSRWRIFQ